MNTIKAKGQLRHRFWGTYSAVMVLAFDSLEAALNALPKLPGWEQSSTSPIALMWCGDRDKLEAAKVVLGGFGADVKKIDSTARSIDYGEPFEVTIPVEP